MRFTLQKNYHALINELISYIVPYIHQIIANSLVSGSMKKQDIVAYFSVRIVKTRWTHMFHPNSRFFTAGAKVIIEKSRGGRFVWKKICRVSVVRGRDLLYSLPTNSLWELWKLEHQLKKLSLSCKYNVSNFLFSVLTFQYYVCTVMNSSECRYN